MRTMVVVAALGLLGIAECTAAQAERFTVELSIDNNAGVPAHILRGAEDEARRIFGRAGIMIKWTLRTRSDMPPPTALTVIVVGTAPPLTHVTSDLLGIAPVGDARRRGRIAYVFYDRVEQFANRHPSSRDQFFDRGQILGAVITHEVGHLLLPLNAGHATAGVMSGVWNTRQFQRAAFGLLEFTPREAEGIRAALKPGSAGTVTGSR